jgi:hypothetical protein
MDTECTVPPTPASIGCGMQHVKSSFTTHHSPLTINCCCTRPTCCHSHGDTVVERLLEYYIHRRRAGTEGAAACRAVSQLVMAGANWMPALIRNCPGVNGGACPAYYSALCRKQLGPWVPSCRRATTPHIRHARLITVLYVESNWGPGCLLAGVQQRRTSDSETYFDVRRAQHFVAVPAQCSVHHVVACHFPYISVNSIPWLQPRHSNDDTLLQSWLECGAVVCAWC